MPVQGILRFPGSHFVVSVTLAWGHGGLPKGVLLPELLQVIHFVFPTPHLSPSLQQGKGPFIRTYLHTHHRDKLSSPQATLSKLKNY